MAIHSSGSLSQIIQFVYYLIIGSCAVVSGTHLTLIARLSNSVSVISPILVPEGVISLCCTRYVSSGRNRVLDQASLSGLWLGVDWATGVVWLKEPGCTVSGSLL